VSERQRARNLLFAALAATVVVATVATLAESQLLGWLAVALGLGSFLLYLRWRRAVRRARLSSAR
jgi:Flp pilus assembly protein TadB